MNLVLAAVFGPVGRVVVQRYNLDIIAIFRSLQLRMEVRMVLEAELHVFGETERGPFAVEAPDDGSVGAVYLVY